MAVITMPTGGIRSVRWALNQPAAVQRSEFTGKTKILKQKGARWTASVEVVPGKLAHVQAWRAFFAALSGQVNSFELKAVETSQVSGVSPIVDTTGTQTPTSIPLKQLVNGGILPAGAMIHVATTTDDWQLFVLTAALGGGSDGAGGFNGTAQVAPPPRKIFGAAGVALATPSSIMRLSSPEIGWTAEPAIYTLLSFQCEEAW